MGRWGFSYIFKFFLEYFGNFIIFIYRIFLRILDKYDNSPLLKKVRIILLTIVIFWVTLVIINIFFSKSNRNFKHYKTCKINNKHPFITILKRFLFFYFFYYYFVKQITLRLKTFILTCKLLERLKLRRLYPTMLYQRFIYASISLILDSYFFFQVILI